MQPSAVASERDPPCAAVLVGVMSNVCRACAVNSALHVRAVKKLNFVSVNTRAAQSLRAPSERLRLLRAVGRRLPHGAPDAWAQMPSLHCLRRRQCPGASRRLVFRRRFSLRNSLLFAPQSVMGNWSHIITADCSVGLSPLASVLHRGAQFTAAQLSFEGAVLPITLHEPNIC